MMDGQEGVRLSAGEILSVLALAGNQSVIGFPPQEVEALTPEGVWAHCCVLQRDGLMTQQNGRFRLSRRLMEVLQPVSKAKNILVLTPRDDCYPQQLIYAADTVSVMRDMGGGRYVLRTLEREAAAEYIMTQQPLCYPELPAAAMADMPPVTVRPEDTRDVLLTDAVLVLERLQPATGMRLGWARLLERGLTTWLQWTDRGSICCGELSKERLDCVVQGMLKGEI